MTSKNKPIKKLKCPKGTRRNKLTKLCVPYTVCADGYIQNKDTWECEPVIDSGVSLNTFYKSQKQQQPLVDLMFKYSEFKNIFPQISFIASGISKQEYQVLYDYTNVKYRIINTFLRTHNATKLKSVKTIKQPLTQSQIKTIDDIFTKIPPLTKSLKVFRGLYYEGINNDAFQDTIKNIQYLSTSLNIYIALAFVTKNIDDAQVFEIYIPKGARIIPLYLSGMYAPSETEILLDRRGSLERITTASRNPNVTAVFKYIPPDYNNLESHHSSDFESPPPAPAPPLAMKPWLIDKFINLVNIFKK